MTKKFTLAWVPNTLTMGNLVFGFLSIVYSSSGHMPNNFQIAGFMILFAALFDGFDGQVARALKVSSQLGKELDSLADLIAFGVAPGYLSYHMFLKDAIFARAIHNFHFGMIIAAIFPICAAYRLARFNVQSSSTYFQGLPSPIAGVVIALQPLIFKDAQIPLIINVLFFIITALLMVSTIRYSKPQAVLLEKLRGIKLIIAIILIIIAFVFLKKWALVILIGLYLISGYAPLKGYLL
jgi:CDP-diacylglycerol--serine O-phosphatidyltransferase